MWRRGSRDHKIRSGWFPIGLGALLTPTLYLASLGPTDAMRYLLGLDKHIPIVTVLDAPRGVVWDTNTTISQRASILQCSDRLIENAL